MIQMTTAEFGKANLTKIEDVVEIRRYNTVVGTFYPAGKAVVTLLAASSSPDSLIGDLKAAEERIHEQEDEIGRLKRLLAAKSVQMPSPAPVPARNSPDDPFSGLAKQDRDFFERKLGKKK
jgi:hypothetical protein